MGRKRETQDPPSNPRGWSTQQPVHHNRHSTARRLRKRAASPRFANAGSRALFKMVRCRFLPAFVLQSPLAKNFPVPFIYELRVSPERALGSIPADLYFPPPALSFLHGYRCIDPYAREWPVRLGSVRTGRKKWGNRDEVP